MIVAVRRSACNLVVITLSMLELFGLLGRVATAAAAAGFLCANSSGGGCTLAIIGTKETWHDGGDVSSLLLFILPVITVALHSNLHLLFVL